MNNQELVQEQYGTAPLRERVNEALDRAGATTAAFAQEGKEMESFDARTGIGLVFRE